MADAQIIKLGPPKDDRFAGGAIALLVGALGLLMLVGAATSVALIEEPADPVRSMYLFVALFGLLGSYVLFYAIRSWREQVFRGASIRIDSGTLTVNDPRGMRAPVTMPLENVRAFCVDTNKSRHVTGLFPMRRTSDWHGVVTPGATQHTRGYFNDFFYRRGAGLPMGTHDYNLLLVFNEPQVFDVNTRVDGERKRLILKASVPAIAIRAQNHRAATELLSASGIRPFVTDTDAEELGPFHLIEQNGSGIDPSLYEAMGWQTRDDGLPSVQPTEGVEPIEEGDLEPPAEEEFEFLEFEPLPSDELGLSPAGIKRAFRNAVLTYYGYLAAVFCLLVGAAYVLYFVLHGPPIISGFLVIWAGTLAFYSFPRSGPSFESNELVVDLDRNPRLMQLIGEQADAVGVQRPSRVTAYMESNASKQNMPFDPARNSTYSICLGVPVLAAVNELEARALISHELGHAKINIGPEDRTARAAMVAWQTAIVFSEHYLLGPVTRFAWLRYLERIARLSRESEYASDRIAADTAGPALTASLLKRLVVVDQVLPHYWSHYVVPALEAGLNPPIAEGFTRYLDDSGFARAVREFVDEITVGGARPDQFETHPDITRRLDYLEKLHPGSVGSGLPPIGRSGASVLQDLRAIERDALGLVMGPDAAMGLRTVDWPEATATAMPLHWGRVAAVYARTFSGQTFRTLTDVAGDMGAWGDALGVPVGFSAPGHLLGHKDVPEDSRESNVGFALYATLATGLIAAGARLEGFTPGSGQSFSFNGREVELSELMDLLIGEEADAERWSAACVELGIGEVRLDSGSPMDVALPAPF